MRCWAWGGSLDGTRCRKRSVGVLPSRRGLVDREPVRKGPTGRIDGFENGIACCRLNSECGCMC